jgi:hypothetical protein
MTCENYNMTTRKKSRRFSMLSKKRSGASLDLLCSAAQVFFFPSIMDWIEVGWGKCIIETKKTAKSMNEYV